MISFAFSDDDDDDDVDDEEDEWHDGLSSKKHFMIRAYAILNHIKG